MTRSTVPLSWFVTRARACSYLPDERASLEYRVYPGMEETEYYEFLRRGWRRHGAHLFRPRCAQCTQCRSLRVLVEQFRPTRSQRRVLQRNTSVEVIIQPPSVTTDHLRLFNAYHADMSARRGWRPRLSTPEDYADSFLSGEWPCAREMLYFRDSELIGVGLVDVLPEAVSSIYFYHHPHWRDGSPGTFSILQELELCRRTGRRYNYLGYWIAACQSMAYKANFRPHEVLAAYVDAPEEPFWTQPAAPAAPREGNQPD
jgi:arginine-tRNA-protein transferase